MALFQSVASLMIAAKPAGKIKTSLDVRVCMLYHGPCIWTLSLNLGSMLSAEVEWDTDNRKRRDVPIRARPP